MAITSEPLKLFLWSKIMLHSEVIWWEMFKVQMFCMFWIHPRCSLSTAHPPFYHVLCEMLYLVFSQSCWTVFSLSTGQYAVLLWKLLVSFRQKRGCSRKEKRPKRFSWCWNAETAPRDLKSTFLVGAVFGNTVCVLVVVVCCQNKELLMLAYFILN